MRYLLLVTSLMFAPSCGKKHDPEDGQQSPRTEELRAAHSAKLAELAGLLDPTTTWPAPTDCDGLLWAGLACGVGAKVNITLAEYEPGEWHRRPPPSCWTANGGDQGSASTISGDMFQGVYRCGWALKDAGMLERMADYGEARNWVMGQPYPEAADRVLLRPNQVGMLGQLLYALTGGEINKPYRAWPAVYAPVAADYARHLQALEISLRGEVAESVHSLALAINDNQLAALQRLADAEPLNPLFAAALGTYNGELVRAVDLLLDPATPVPTYVRCNNQRACELVAWLTASKLALSHLQ